MKKGIVLKASAGTGKTYRLSLEYIKLLLEGSRIDEILVTTFTKKATFEIKERIIKHLKDLSNGNRELLSSLKEIGLKKEVNNGDFMAIYERVIFNKHKLKIFTIDGFINTAFNRFVVPYFNLYGYTLIDRESNLSYNMAILERIVQNNEHFRVFKNFFDNFMEKDVTSYVKWIDEIVRNRWRFMLLRKSSKEKRYPDNLKEPFIDLQKSFKKLVLMKNSGENFADYLKPEFINLTKIGEEEKILSEYLDKFLALDEKSFFWNGTRLKKNRVNSSEYSNLINNYYKFKKSLGNHIYNNKIIPLELEIQKIAEIIFAEYDDLKNLKRELTHDDVLTYTYKFISLPGNRVEIVDRSVNRFLIDEFQDTGILQWNILKSLIKSDSSFIFVGDEKQAIYGWRGGERDLLLNLPAILECREEVLKTSYRSQKEIIKFINSFFGKMGLIKEGIQNLSSKSNGYVNIAVGDRNGNKERIVKKIIDKKISLKDSAIILRTNSELEEMAMYLRRYNIPHIKESALSVTFHRAVRPAYLLLNFFSTSNFLDFLKFLRSEIVNINSATMKHVINEKGNIELYFKGEINDLNFKNKVMDTFRIVKTLINSPLDRQIKGAFKSFNILNKYGTIQDAKNIELFIKLGGKFNQLSQFLSYLQNAKNFDEFKQVGIEDLNAIKLLTVHRSKGLEFKTVFVNWHFSYRTTLSIQKFDFNTTFDNKYQYISDYCFTAKELSNTLNLAEFDYEKNKKERELMEELNNLYVGLTRASDNLHFLISFDRSIQSLDSLRVGSLDGADKFFANIRYAILKSTGFASLQELQKTEYEVGKISNIDLKDTKKMIRYNLYFLDDHFKDKKEESIKSRPLNYITIKKAIIEDVARFYLAQFKRNFENEKKEAIRKTLVKFREKISNRRIDLILRSIDDHLLKNGIWKNKEIEILNDQTVFYGDEELKIDKIIVNKQVGKVTIIDYNIFDEIDNKRLDHYKRALEPLFNNYKIESRAITIEIKSEK